MAAMPGILPAQQSNTNPTMHSTDIRPHTSWATTNCPVFMENDEISRRIARSLSFSHPVATQFCSMRRMSATSSAMVSLEDYERLPASIKRKFFSSTERLHIAQQSAKKHRRRKLSLGGASPSFTTSHDQARPATSGGGIARRSSRRKSKDPNAAFTDLTSTDITEEQAHWYLSLPDKIRKQQFTRREQITFALQCKRALENSAPDFAQDALRRCLNLGREDDFTYDAKERRRGSFATVDTDILLDEALDHSGSLDLRSDSLLDGSNPAEDYSTPVLPVSKSMVDISLPASSPPLPRTKQRSNSVSLRRKSHNHLTPLPLPPPQLAPAPPLPPLPAAFGNFQFAGTTPIPTQLPSVEPKIAPLELRSDCKPHQPSDVRKQLRQWLTPEKFDEALEFGFSFPSHETPPLSLPSNDSTPQQPPPLCHTDDDFSEEDGTDSLENAGPMTPTTVPDHLFHTAKKPSFDSSADVSFRSTPFSLWNRPRKHGPVESQAEREMTVRVTLTRRELRERGDPVYSVGRHQSPGVVDVERVDPLALEAISVCDDPTGAHGAFAVSAASTPKGLKKVWRALRRH